MVTSKKTLEKIKEIIDKHYNKLTISLLGRSAFSEKELKQMKEEGIDTSKDNSFLEMVYHHNFINTPEDKEAPTSVSDMKAQQSVKGLTPEGEAHEYTIENQTDKTKQLLDKLKQDVNARIQGVIRDNNDKYKMNALQNLDRPDLVDDLVKESSIGKVKQQIKDLSGVANRDFTRIAVTEMSNVIGIASVDRVVSQNTDKNLDDVYVYRIPVNDAKLCKYCRRFYLDSDDSPKVYKLSTLLGNGSNYGKKATDYLPVVGATHPNERCSQIIELKPGFKVLPGGTVTYIGLDKWNDYLFEKVKQ